jgi:aldehyde dehydrogenase (NAD+)
VNERAFDRVSSLVSGSEILHGGKCDRKDLFVEPTLVSADAASVVMKEEIFGPVLPVVSVSGVDEAVRFVNDRPKPLALYVFTRDRAVADRFMTETTSGGLLVNDVVVHLPQPDLPFGGVGPSGMGAYHGRFSFEAFTHAKGVLKKSFAMDVPARYAPYTPGKFRMLKWLFS